MITFLRRLFRREPRAWAVQIIMNWTDTKVYLKWTKVVSTCRPVPMEYPGRYWVKFGIQGPFRSEVDCDEFVDKANGVVSAEQKEEWES